MPDKKKIKVVIRREGGELKPFTGSPPKSADKVVADIGDTIRWEMPGASVRINFLDGKSPFDGPNAFAGDDDHVVTKEGHFPYQCGVTINGEEFGWPKNPTPGSGGEVVIERRKSP